MKLTKVTIEGYRSITQRLTFYVEPNVTVILGPNDHGKTNVLSAIAHLNADNPFSVDADLNWDSIDKDNVLPEVSWEFELDAHTQDVCAGAWAEYAAARVPAGDMRPEAEPKSAFLSSIPKIAVFRRKGISSALLLEGWENLPEDVQKAATSQIPRVEIIRASERVTDSVTAAELVSSTGTFMRGIFYYAGLDPLNAADLFTQNPSTEKRLSTASIQLDRHLKQSWTQGENLSFLLRHHSADQSIRLMIDDPNVSGRYVFASSRSAGFSNYFAIKTILHARQQEHRSAAYLWLFDEPGLYLHPAGQFDLLRTIETLSATSQLVYVTHSLFLINKTYPTRHRLILKEGTGTKIEAKPYVGRWARTLSALGLTLSGTILFANYVILTEGDSDPIYLEALYQHYIQAGLMNYDLNSLAVMATGDGRNAEALLRMLVETQPAPKIVVLFDGDAGGKERYEDLEALLKRHSVRHVFLKSGTSIEDHLPNSEDEFVRAVYEYTTKLCADRQIVPPDSVQKARESFEKKGETHGRSAWAKDFVRTAAKLKSAPSKIGIAREYVARLTGERTGDVLRSRDSETIDLLERLALEVGLPKQELAEARVLSGQQQKS